MPTITLSPSPSATPEQLPLFSSTLLRPEVLQTAYIADACSYLRLRWSADSSPPGTVAIPVMFHSIVESGGQVTDAKDISEETFRAFVAYAQYLGFETITTAQLRDFLLFNALIPPRSMILIVDDRRPGLIEQHFLPVLEANDWTVTPAYIADPYSLDWAWELMDRLYETGRLDVQSHGYSGQLYIVPETPVEEIQAEIWDSTAVLEARFGQRPIAFIWPGGNFTARSVQIAREGGYELGFSALSPGLLMFNWVPLDQQAVEKGLVAVGPTEVNDPLMVLPRTWSRDASLYLDVAVRLSDQARTFAEQNYSFEADWYAQWCGGGLGE